MTADARKTADEFIDGLIARGFVNDADVQSLEKHVNSDWIVDHSEVEALFRMNQAIGHRDEECPAWGEFFVAAASRLIVLDLDTPGEIDEREGDWLEDLLQRYSIGNQSEGRLLDEIRATAKKISGRVAKRMQ
jgi:hypothetical protein